MADLKISQLAALAGAYLATADELAIVDSSASETKKITVTDLVGNATTLIADATIPGAKILFSAGDIAGTAIADGGISTAKVADDAITAAKLGNESTVDLVTTLPGTGAFTGQIALDTDDNKIYIWDGSAWQSVKGAGSVNVVNGSTAGIVNIATSTSGDTVTIATSLDNTTAAKQFLAGPTGAAGAVAYRVIEGTDLPFAGATETGGVQVSGDGLRMDTGRIEIDNDVTATGGSYKIVDVNAKGLVTGYKDIESADLPIATDATPGVVSPGTDLDVSAAGVLNHEEKIAGGGTFTKVTVNATGHITAGTTLAEADVPSLNASKIGAGALPTARVADDAITGAKLADYSISKIAESAPTAEYIGQLFFNPLDRTLFMWDGNVYQPIGVSYGQVIFSGTYSAATNLITSITPDGAAIGLAIGASLVSPVAATRSHYVVIDEAGTGSAPAPAVSLSPPDILLSTGSDWVLLDVSDTVTAQLASNVQVTPAGNISSTNVQAALQELDTEKLQLTGGTLTGDLNLGVDVNVTFEGANANQYETTLTVADPTADNTVTIPDESGTVVTTGSSGVVTSTMITDGTIVDADISSSAEIEVSKLVDGSARQLLQTDAAGTGVEWASNIDIPGTLDVTGATTLDSTLTVPLGSAAAPTLRFTGDTNTGIYSPGADQVAISTNGTGRLFVDASGRFHIGTNTSAHSYIQTVYGSTTGNRGAGTVYQNATTGSDANNGFLIGNSNGSDAYVWNYENANTILATSGTERLRITSTGQLSHIGGGTSGSPAVGFNGSAPSNSLVVNSTGKVGLGTSSPSQLLHVKSGSSATTGLFEADGNSTVEISRSSAASLPGSSRLLVSSYGRLGITSDDHITFSTGSNGSSIAERLRIDSSGNVGIGTTAPTTALHIRRASGAAVINLQSQDGVQASLVFGDITDESRGKILYSNNNEAMQFYVNNLQEAMRIDSSGNVGIGEDNPEAPLHVGSADSWIDIGQQSGNRSKIGFNNNIFYYGNSSSVGQYVWKASTTRSGNPWDSGNERMRIDNSGRLLIGTSSSIDVASTVPAIMQVTQGGTGLSGAFYSTANASGPGGVIALGHGRNSSSGLLSSGDVMGQIRFAGADGTDMESVGAQISTEVDGTPGTNDMPGRLVFSTTADGASGPTERLRIDSSGNVFIGGTTAASADIALNADGSGTFKGQVRSEAENVASFVSDKSNGYHFYAADVNTVKFVVNQDGAGTFAGTVSAQGSVLTSDQRFKENITDANAQLADVTALGNSLRNWDWTDDAPVADKETRFLGLVAQEAEAICPGIVATIARTKDGDELTPEVVVPAVYETRTVPAVLDEEGEVVEAETTEEVLITEEQVTPATYEQLDDSYKGIKNDILIMKLLGAVAELSAKVAALEAS